MEKLKAASLSACRTALPYILASLLFAPLTLVPAQAAGKQAVIVDTDMGPDDWIAISYLAANPNIELVGITIVGNGLTPCPEAAHNAQYLLSLSPKTTNVPVGCGAPFPMDGFASYPSAWKQGSIEMLGERTAASNEKKTFEDSATLLAKLLKQSEEPIEILTIGALTNVAAALTADPKLSQKIKRITMMGGAVDQPGNVRVHGFTDNHPNTRAEWNFFIDPLATKIVFESPVPLRLVPLDATNKVPLRVEFLKRVSDLPPGPLSSFVARTFDRISKATANGEYYHWDPLAAVVLAKPSICDVANKRRLIVNANKGSDTGVSVGTPPDRFPFANAFGQRRSALDAAAAGATLKSKTGKSVEVCAHVPTAAFENEFLNTLR